MGVLTRSMTRALAMAKVENCETRSPAHPHSMASSSSSAVPMDIDGDGGCSETMDPHIWSQLPEHLMEMVLAHLTIPGLLRLRSVCSAWNALPESPRFLELHNELLARRPPSSWFYVYRNQDYREGAIFDPALNRWFRVAPPSFAVGIGHRPPCPNQDSRMILPIASAGGLVCFSASTSGGHTTLIVANPVTKSWRELPPMLRIQTYRMASMTVDRRIPTYKIVVVGFYGLFHPTTEVFSSITNSWVTSGDIPHCPLFPSRRSLISDYDGVLYAWCDDPPDGLLAYDMNLGVWSQMYAPIRHSLDSHVLVEWNRTIYTIGGVRRRNAAGRLAAGSSSICVWALDRDECEWKKVDCMPETLCDEFLAGGQRFVCIGGADGLVLLVVRSRDRLALLYDLRRKIWRRLPGSPVADEGLRYGLIAGVAYEPRLDAEV